MALGSLGIGGVAQAVPNDWSPLESKTGVRSIIWTEWLLQPAASADKPVGLPSTIWKFTQETPGALRNVATISKEDGRWIFSAQERQRLHRASVADPSDFPEVVLASVELNGDGIPDYILRYDPHGNGLAAIGQEVALILSGGTGHRSHRLHQFGFAENSLVQFHRDGPWHWVVCDLVRTDSKDSKDGREHSFWVYRLFRVVGDSLMAEPEGVEGFPRWIQYLKRPNHRETSLLSSSQKRRRERKLAPPSGAD